MKDVTTYKISLALFTSVQKMRHFLAELKESMISFLFILPAVEHEISQKMVH